jgi:hypothetical protein
VVGHDIRTFADCGRRLDLGVERHAPIERRRFDGDLALMFGVEVFDELLHAGAVAAAEEIPPHDVFLRESAADCGAQQCRAEKRGGYDLTNHDVLSR